MYRFVLLSVLLAVSAYAESEPRDDGFFAKHFGWFKHRFGSQPIATDPVARDHPEPTRITIPVTTLDPIDFTSESISDAPSEAIEIHNTNSTETIKVENEQ
ncbi:hypothetical protein QR680_016149 [Steinernema hermaphroditum]|uniref:Uncharacterized protein n=1 Tax=Steinernema hermaphroditum TaxID=289476 RepID=A0AA39LM46_9BILA|nr:hypothetical protein QR680_016149 [Steinernema hermaphroditum]